MKTVSLRTIGKIVGAQGLRGEVRVKPWDDDAKWVGVIKYVYLFKPTGPVEMEILSAHQQQGVIILKLSDVNTRDEAEQLKGVDIKANDADLPALEDNEYYVDELVGLAVKSLDSHVVLGTVRDILSSTAGDFLEVNAPGIEEPVLLPFQDIFVPQVDIAARIVYVTGLDNLFEPD